MKAQQNPLNGILIVGVIMLFVFGGQLAGMILQPDNIWWTPESMKLSIEESKDRVDIYIKDERLVDILRDSVLLLKDDSEIVELKTADITFRFNNRDKVKASQMTNVAMASSAVMAGLMMIVYALVWRKKTGVTE